LVLRYYEELTDAEIAAALGISTGTVRSQASRALGKLRAGWQLSDDAMVPNRGRA
jgi:RNA polymerase sigma factor (sigma-70 family)